MCDCVQCIASMPSRSNHTHFGAYFEPKHGYTWHTTVSFGEVACCAAHASSKHLHINAMHFDCRMCVTAKEAYAREVGCCCYCCCGWWHAFCLNAHMDLVDGATLHNSQAHDWVNSQQRRRRRRLCLCTVHLQTIWRNAWQAKVVQTADGEKALMISDITKTSTMCWKLGYDNFIDDNKSCILTRARIAGREGRWWANGWIDLCIVSIEVHAIVDVWRERFMHCMTEHVRIHSFRERFDEDITDFWVTDVIFVELTNGKWGGTVSAWAFSKLMMQYFFDVRKFENQIYIFRTLLRMHSKMPKHNFEHPLSQFQIFKKMEDFRKCNPKFENLKYTKNKVNQNHPLTFSVSDRKYVNCLIAFWLVHQPHILPLD